MGTVRRRGLVEKGLRGVAKWTYAEKKGEKQEPEREEGGRKGKEEDREEGVRGRRTGIKTRQ